ncbi:MAG: F0F1 ATP synthase subunit delta [Alphaproteobacteria bacterium]|nr:F0F1 ATP synthase subunit delta [Alphaproteobacteria bacterium]TAD90442.1 MAG: F0F1 ATP synthase subunit delta [Alphaproteobacteria bacterium]
MATQTTGLKGLAERYAVALYDLADSQGALDAVAQDLRLLSASVASVPEFQRLLTIPVLKRDVVATAVMAVVDHLGVTPLTRNLVGVLAQNRRLAALVPVANAFLARLADKRGEVTVEVTSAQPLSWEQVEQLSQRLRASVAPRITINQSVDPTLIGGLVVKVGSKLVDHSLKTKLMRLQLAMKGVA